MTAVLTHRHLEPDVPVTGHELRSARRTPPASAHARIIRCVCGAWAWAGMPCDTCAALAAARAAR